MRYPTVENLFDEMFNDFNDEFFGVPRRGLMRAPRRENALMRTDVSEKDDAYELKVDLPGFKKDNIKVKLDDGFLTISAEQSSEKVEREDESGKARKNGRIIRQERYLGAMSRSWYVGDAIKQKDIKASYKNGVLSLTVPKATPHKELPEDKKYIAIEG